MGYIAVTGGEGAIEASIERLKYLRLRGGKTLDVDAVQAGMRGLVDQVMSEASLYDEPIAALAIKQAEGSPEEAVFLMRAFRSTLPRSHYSIAIDPRKMRVDGGSRRASRTYRAARSWAPPATIPTVSSTPVSSRRPTKRPGAGSRNISPRISIPKPTRLLRHPGSSTTFAR